jgi:hypothetical protein
MPEKSRPAFASDPIPRHLLRAAIGFGLLGSVFLLIPSLDLAALLLALPGLLALRGPPPWGTAGLIRRSPAGGCRPHALGAAACCAPQIPRGMER